MRKTIVVLVTVLFMVASFGLANAARDYINIVGSSTVYPFATVVASSLVNPPLIRRRKLNLPVPAAVLSFFVPVWASSIRISPTPRARSRNPSTIAVWQMVSRRLSK